MSDSTGGPPTPPGPTPPWPTPPGPTPPASIPPGWYPDPAGTGRPRWWDGAAWTPQYGPPQYGPAQYGPPQYGPAQYGPPTYGPPPYRPAPAARPEIDKGTPVYNPFIWIIVLLPLLSIALVLLWNPEFRWVYLGRRNTPTPVPASMFSPAYFLLVLSGFLTYGVTVLMAYLDSQKLSRDGVVRPFHWAWSFAGAAVYVIGRSVIVNKVAPGRGLVPIWVLIGVVVLSVVAVSIKMSVMFSSLASSLPM